MSERDAFRCPERHRSFLDRFRMPTGPKAPGTHRPRAGSEHVRKVEWAEFPGVFVPTRAARCVDCNLPIVNALANLWGVRLHDRVDEERRAVVQG